MKTRGTFCFLILTFLLSTAAGLSAVDHYQVVNGPKDFYYGHISYVDPTETGPETVILREGRQRGLAGVLNTPIAPGDTVRTPAGRRCEIQFDTGTIIRLDFDSELKIETVLAKSLSADKSLTNLVLNRGRMYVMYKEYGGKEIFQVLTPGTAVKLKHSTVAVISAGTDSPAETQVDAGRADVLFGSSEKKTDSRVVTKGKRLILSGADSPQFIPAFEGGAFSLWNEGLNGRFVDLHEGQTAIPKPIQKYPPAVQYFAQKYGNLYGEWIWDGMLGYVWRPAGNNISIPGYDGTKYSGVNGWEPGRGWQPYVYGQWTMANGQMFWVPQEPWGWVPYHLGLWHWNKKLGWVWIPGSTFSPAWADWHFFFGSKGFMGMGMIWLNCSTPVSIYQWMAAGNAYNYFSNIDISWFQEWMNKHPRWSSYGMWVWGYGMTRDGYVYQHDTRFDNLFSDKKLSPIPRDIIKKISAAVKNRDARVREELTAAAFHSVIVSGGNNSSSTDEKLALPIDDFEKFARLSGLEFGGGGPVAGLQFQAKTDHAVPAAAPAVVVDGQPVEGALRQVGDPFRSLPAVKGSAARKESPAPRFRDWNPDLQVARELGVRIEYQSGKNEIYCPDLNLSSADRTSGMSSPRMTSSGTSGFAPSGAVRSATSGFVGNGSGSSSSGSSSSSTSRDVSRSSGGSADRSSGGKK